jgi:hypothetical protein
MCKLLLIIDVNLLVIILGVLWSVSINFKRENTCNKYSDGTALCNLCTQISDSYEVRKINDDVKLNICNKCDKGI